MSVTRASDVSRTRACFPIMRACSASAEESHESPWGEIRHQVCRVLHARHASHTLGSQVAAAHRAFHGGGPSGGSPVPCQEDARPNRLWLRTVILNAGLGRVRRMAFLDDG